MTRVLSALVGVLLLAVTALALVWLAGQLLTGLGAAVSGTASVLFRLLGFLLLAGGLGGVVFFIASAWRPVRPAAAGLSVFPAGRGPTAPSASQHPSAPTETAPPQAEIVIGAVPGAVRLTKETE